MPATTSVKAVEGSTYVVNAAFTDENGNAIVPVTATWTLTDSRGNVVNSREDISITPATSVDIVLSGDDLVISTYGMERVLTIEGTYSSAYGSDLPFADTLKFEVVDIVVKST